MRTVIKLLVAAGLVFGSFMPASAQAQIYVKVRPVAPVAVAVRPARPAPDYIWVTDEWVPDGATYRFVAGHWERPPHHGARWHGGHWVHDKDRGHYWVAGGWK